MLGRLAQDGAAGLDEVADFGQQRGAHGRLVRQHQHPVRQAVRQHEPAVLHRHPILDHIRVDVVEAVAGGQRGLLLAGHLGRVLADEVGHVGHRQAGLQKHGAAALVIDPRFPLRKPGVEAIELCPERRREARGPVVRLVNGEVQRVLGDAFAVGPIAARFQAIGIAGERGPP